jgi:hypothetical protein
MKICIADFESRTARRNQLSAVDVLGSFDFSTATIQLKSLGATDIERVRVLLNGFDPDWNGGAPSSLSGEQFLALAKVYPLAVHEYTHFIDATSTLWGLRHLQLMNEAYMSNAEVGGIEKDYHKAKKFFDHIRSIRLPSYYTVVYKQPHNGRPWASKITIGRIFDTKGGISDRPVLFAQFLNSNGELLVRSPISTVSILEASAMAQEVLSHKLLLQLTDTDFRLVERQNFSRKHIEFLYTREVTEYSVCVHILANTVGYKDVIVAFAMCAQLTRIVLNFPAIEFNKLVDCCPVEDVFQLSEGHELVRAIRDGLRVHDLGTLYYLLCSALPKNVSEGEIELQNSIATALKTLGVDVQVIINEGDVEAQHLISSVSASPLGYIKSLALSGYENFKRTAFTQAALMFNELNVPPSLLGDDTVVNIFSGDKNWLEKFDLEGCFYELDEGMSWVNQFAEGCL